MKRNLLVWFLGLLFVKIIAQQNNFAHHRRVDAVSGMACINSKCFYLERIDYTWADSLNIIGVNDNGLLFMKKKLPLFYSLRILRKVIKTSDNHLAALYHASHSCDVTGGKTYISKFDTLGNVVFDVQSNATGLHTGSDYFPIDFIQQGDSSYYILTKSEIHHHSKTGQFISKVSPLISSMSCIASLNNGNLFISSPTAVSELDSNFNFVSIVSSSMNVTKFVQTSSGKSFALSATGNLVRLSSNFSLVVQSQIAGYKLTDFVCRNDSVFAVGHSITVSEPYYCVFDSSLNILYSTSNTYKGIIPVSIDLSKGNMVNVVAKAYGSWPSVYRTFFRFPVNGNYLIPGDVGITTYSLNGPVMETSQYYFTANFNVEVKNFSNQAVQGFNLNANLYSSACPQSWQKWYDTLIPAGASVRVNTGVIHLVAGKANNKANLCLYTSTPGNQADSDPSNDLFCDSVSFSPVEVVEWGALEAKIELFPNPFNTELTITSEMARKGIQIMNVLGQKIMEMQTDSRELKMNTEALLGGIYFIRIETDKGALTKKLIKD